MVQAPMMGFIELMLAVFAYTGLAVPFGLPPGPEDPFLSQIAPETPLFYASWSGSIAPDADSQNQTERLLAEPEIQQLLSKLRAPAMQVVKMNLPPDPSGNLIAGAIENWVPKLVRQPGAIFVSDIKFDRGDTRLVGAMVVNVGDDVEAAHELLEAIDKTVFRGQIEKVKIAGTVFRKLQPDPNASVMYWGIRNQHLIIGNGAKGVIARSKTETPGWLQQVRDDLSIPRRSMLAYFNVKKTLELAKIGSPEIPDKFLEEVGIDRIHAIATATGLSETRAINQTKIFTDGVIPPILRVFASRPITRKTLAAVPNDANVLASIDIDLTQAFSVAQATARIAPDTAEEFAAGLASLNQWIGGDIENDVLPELSGTWTVFNSPSEGGVFLTGLTAIAELKNAGALMNTMQPVIRLLEKQFRDVDELSYHTTKVQDTAVHAISIEGSPLVASWCFHDQRLIVSLNQQNIRTFLSRPEAFRSIENDQRLQQRLGDQPTMITFVDSRQIVEMFYPLLPYAIQPFLFEMSQNGIQLDSRFLPTLSSISKHISPSISTAVREADGIKITSHQTIPGISLTAVVPIAATASIPSVVMAQATARQNRSINNLRQIAIAILNHESAFGKLPAAALHTKDGKPGLSWRVAILPFIEEQALYNEFHRDEPWNSPHNIKLLDRMPAVFRSPMSKADPTKTVYLTIRGEQSAIVEDGKGLKIRTIADGLSKTILAIEVDDQKAVPWTKPDDFDWNEENPLQGLGNQQRGPFFLSVFCDGSVQKIKREIPKQLFKAAYTRDGAEPLDQAALAP